MSSRVLFGPQSDFTRNDFYVIFIKEVEGVDKLVPNKMAHLLEIFILSVIGLIKTVLLYKYYLFDIFKNIF